MVGVGGTVEIAHNFCILVCALRICDLQVLFCRLTDFQRELYEDFLRSPEFHAMLSQRLKVWHLYMCMCCTCVYLRLHASGDARLCVNRGRNPIQLGEHTYHLPGECSPSARYLAIP